MKNKRRMGILILALVLFCGVFSTVGYAESNEYGGYIFDDYIVSMKSDSNNTFLPEKDNVPTTDGILGPKIFVIKFNQEVDAWDASQNITLWKNVDGKMKPVGININSKLGNLKAVKLFPRHMEKNTEYLLIIEKNLTSKKGESLKGHVFYKFTTEKDEKEEEFVVKVIEGSPENYYKKDKEREDYIWLEKVYDIKPDKVFRVTFNKMVGLEPLYRYFGIAEVLEDSLRPIITYEFSENGGKTVRIEPEEPLKPNTEYVLLIERGLESYNGKILSKKVSMPFFTGPKSYNLYE